MPNKTDEQVLDEARQSLEEIIQNDFVNAFNEIQRGVNDTAHDKGWYDSPIKELLNDLADKGAVSIKLLKELQNLEDMRRLNLIHSEVSEATENVRAGFTPDDKIPKFSGVEAELADVIIRIMDFSQERGFRVAEAIVAKAAFNKSRPYRHGNKAC